MDNRPVNLFLQKIEENARKVFSSLPEDNGGNRSRQRNCTLVKIKEEETGDEIQVKYVLFLWVFISFSSILFTIILL